MTDYVFWCNEEICISIPKVWGSERALVGEHMEVQVRYWAADRGSSGLLSSDSCQLISPKRWSHSIFTTFSCKGNQEFTNWNVMAGHDSLYKQFKPRGVRIFSAVGAYKNLNLGTVQNWYSVLRQSCRIRAWNPQGIYYCLQVVEVKIH